MAKIQMEVITEPKQGTASVLVPGPDGQQVMIKGHGDVTYTCGCCGKPICENIQRGQVRDIVFKCFNCSSFNRIRGT